jgi:hypothetical protein
MDAAWLCLLTFMSGLFYVTTIPQLKYLVTLKYSCYAGRERGENVNTHSRKQKESDNVRTASAGRCRE